MGRLQNALSLWLILLACQHENPSFSGATIAHPELTVLRAQCEDWDRRVPATRRGAEWLRGRVSARDRNWLDRLPRLGSNRQRHLVLGLRFCKIFFCNFPCSDVGRNTEHLHCFLIFVADNASVSSKPPNAAVAAQNAILGRILVAAFYALFQDFPSNAYDHPDERNA